MAYALGTHARAICDRCGFNYPYLELTKFIGLTGLDTLTKPSIYY